MPTIEKTDSTPEEHGHTKVNPIEWTAHHLHVLTEVIAGRVKREGNALKIKTRAGIDHVIHLGSVDEPTKLPPHQPEGITTLQHLPQDVAAVKVEQK